MRSNPINDLIELRLDSIYKTSDVPKVSDQHERRRERAKNRLRIRKVIVHLEHRQQQEHQRSQRYRDDRHHGHVPQRKQQEQRDRQQSNSQWQRPPRKPM